MDNKKSFRNKLIERAKNYKFHKLFGLDLDVFILVALLVFCCGLAPGAAMLYYIFGFIFFLPGLLCGLKVKGFGLIFLVSHGIFGFLMMVSAFISTSNLKPPLDFTSIINHPSFTDGGIPSNIMIYFIVFAIILLSAIIYTVVYNLSNKIKEEKIHIRIILLLYFISIVLAGLFPKIFSYLFK